MSQELSGLNARELEQAEKDKQQELERAKELARNGIPPHIWQQFTIEPALSSAAPLNNHYYLALYHLANNNIKQASKILNNYNQALKLLEARPAAAIYYFLGICCLFSTDLRNKPTHFFEKAYKKKFLLAGFPLALCYLYGWKATKNSRKAINLYRELADQGSQEAVLHYLKWHRQERHDPTTPPETIPDLQLFKSQYPDLLTPRNWQAYYFAGIYFKSELVEESATRQVWHCVEAILSEAQTASLPDIYLAIIHLIPQLAGVLAPKIFDALEKELLSKDQACTPSFSARTSNGHLLPTDYLDNLCFKPFMIAYQTLINHELENNEFPHLKIAYEFINENLIKTFLQSHKEISKRIIPDAKKIRKKLLGSAEIIFLTGGSETLRPLQAASLLYDIHKEDMLTRIFQNLIFNKHIDCRNSTQAKTDQKKSFTTMFARESCALEVAEIKTLPSDTSSRLAKSSHDKFNLISWSLIRKNLLAEFAVTFVPELVHEFHLLIFRQTFPNVINLLDIYKQASTLQASKDREQQRAKQVIAKELPENLRVKFDERCRVKSEERCRLKISDPLETMYYLGLYYLENNNFAHAFDTLLLYKALAEKSKKIVPPALYYYLGFCCLNNDKWLHESAKYFYQAVDNGHTISIFTLAHCYRNGLGLKRSPQRAAQCYELLAEQGNIEAIIEFLELHLWQGNPPEKLPATEQMLEFISKACPEIENWRALYYTAVYYKSRPDLFMGEDFQKIVARLFTTLETPFQPASLQRIPREIYLQLSTLFAKSAAQAIEKLLEEIAKEPALTLFSSSSNNYEYVLRFAPVALCYARGLSMGLEPNSQLDRILLAVKENSAQVVLSAVTAMNSSYAAVTRDMINECAKIIFVLGGTEVIGLKTIANILHELGQFAVLSLSAQSAVLHSPLPLATDLEKKRESKTSFFSHGSAPPEKPTPPLPHSASAILDVSSSPKIRSTSHPAASFIESTAHYSSAETPQISEAASSVASEAVGDATQILDQQ